MLTGKILYWAHEQGPVRHKVRLIANGEWHCAAFGLFFFLTPYFPPLEGLLWTARLRSEIVYCSCGKRHQTFGNLQKSSLFAQLR